MRRSGLPPDDHAATGDRRAAAQAQACAARRARAAVDTPEQAFARRRARSGRTPLPAGRDRRVQPQELPARSRRRSAGLRTDAEQARPAGPGRLGRDLAAPLGRGAQQTLHAAHAVHLAGGLAQLGDRGLVVQLAAQVDHASATLTATLPLGAARRGRSRSTLAAAPDRSSAPRQVRARPRHRLRHLVTRVRRRVPSLGSRNQAAAAPIAAPINSLNMEVLSLRGGLPGPVPGVRRLEPEKRGDSAAALLELLAALAHGQDLARAPEGKLDRGVGQVLQRLELAPVGWAGAQPSRPE